MRWRLKTIFAAMTLICIVLSRLAFVHSQHEAWEKIGARIYFDWQGPSLNSSEKFVAIFDDGSCGTIGKTLEHKIKCAKRFSQWQGMARCMVDNSPIYLEIDAENVTQQLVENLDTMPSLQAILLTNASDYMKPAYPATESALDLLKNRPSIINVYLQIQLAN